MPAPRKLPDELKVLRPGAVSRPANEIWDRWVKDIEAHTRSRACGGKTKLGYPCPKSPLSGRTRCSRHGGATVRGAAHPRYNGGRSDFIARSLPKHLRESFQASMEDEHLMELRVEIALVDTQLRDLLRRGRIGATESAWERLEGIRGDMVTALAEGKGDAIHELMAEWKSIMGTTGDDAELRMEMRRTMDLRRKLVRTEQQRFEALQGYITVERMMAFVAHVVDILTRTVPRQYLKDPINELGRYIPEAQAVSLPSLRD